MADQVNDAMYSALSAFAGEQLNEKVASWLRSEGATGSSLNDLWHSFWDARLITGEHFNQRMVSWLLSEGAVGDQYNDLQHNYWTDRAAAP